MGIIINGQNDTIGPVDNTMSLLGTVSIGGTMTIEDFTNIDSVGLITARNGLRVDGDYLRVNTNVDSPLDLNVTDDGPIYTSLRRSGTRVAYYGFGGSNSTFNITNEVANGSTIITTPNDFSVNTNSNERFRIRSDGRVTIGTQTINTNSMLSIHRGSSDESQIRFTNTTTGEGGNNGLLVGIDSNEHGRIFNQENSPLRFGTNNTERLRIDSAGRLLAGTTTEGHTDADDLTLQAASGFTGITLRSATDMGGAIYFSDATSGDSEYDGQIVYYQSTRQLMFATAATPRLRITSAGWVGVNCTPFAQFHVKTGTNANISMSTMSSEASIEANNDAGSANVPLRLRASVHKFFIGSTEGLRVHTNGLVGVGYDSPTAYGRMTVAMPSQSGGAAIQVANSSLGSGDGTTSNIVLRSVNNNGNNWADAEYRASQHIFAIQGSEKVRISSGGLAINKNSAADTEIEILQSADPTLRLYDTRNTAYKADFMMAGSAPLIRNNNTTASNRTLTVQKGTTDHLVIEGNGSVRKPLQPSFMANFGSNNNTSHANGDYMKLNNTDHNTGNCYNTSNYRFTAPVAGNYLFYGRANMSGVGSGDYARSYQVRIFKNGVSQQFHMSRTTITGYSGSYPDTSTMVCSINLAVNDYVQLKVNWETDGQGLGTNENLHHHGSMFGGYLIG